MLRGEGSMQLGPQVLIGVGPRGQVQGPRGTLPLTSRLPFVDFLRSIILSYQNNDPPKFIAHYDVVKVLKQSMKEKGVFCLRRINSIKRVNHHILSKIIK